MKSVKIYILPGLILFLTCLSWLSSCTHDGDITDLPEVCFEGDILPIFANSCALAGCHDGHGESDLVLNNYLDISHAVVPGDPYSSEVYKSIIATFGEKKMPPDQPFSVDNRTLIRIWIEQGARLTICPDVRGINENGFPDN